MLSQLLTKDNILFLPSAADWQTAIRLAAKPLVESGAATEAYVERMIDSVRTDAPSTPERTSTMSPASQDPATAWSGLAVAAGM